MLPQSIQNLIEEFLKLPGVGPKTAERFVFYLAKISKKELKNFLLKILELQNKIKLCKLCYNFYDKDGELCDICSSPKRERSIVCVIADVADLIAIEKALEFKGMYHILGGVLSPTAGITPEALRIKELVKRIREGQVKEVILALNPDTEGEITALYLARVLKSLGIRITRLGVGLPIGSNVEYADELTLKNALVGRKEVSS